MKATIATPALLLALVLIGLLADAPAPRPGGAPACRSDRSLGRDGGRRYDALILRHAHKRGLNPRLVKAIIATESQFAPQAVSHSGARGLMQVMPATAKEFGVKTSSLLDPETNISVGTEYLAQLFKTARGRAGDGRAERARTVRRVLAAYHSGPGALTAGTWSEPTRSYVRAVLLCYALVGERAARAPEGKPLARFAFSAMEGARMVRKHDRSFARAESGAADALKGAGGDPQAAVGAVADVVARDLRESGRPGAALLSAISALAFGVAHAAVATGGEMGCIAQGFLLGVMLAGEAKEQRLLAVIGHAAGTFIKHAAEAGGDAAAATRGLVEGAVSWAGEMSLDPGEAAYAAGQGAVDAAEDVAPRLGAKVRGALEQPVAGVKVLLKEPVGAASE